MVEGDPVAFSRPSVDVLFNSMAQNAPGKVVASLLTSMGRDGAQGLLNIKNSGGHTLAQDEKSCVVFGMPHAAQNIGAVADTTPLSSMAEEIFAKLGHSAFVAGLGFAGGN